MLALSPFELPASVLLALWAPLRTSRGLAVLQGEDGVHDVQLRSGHTLSLSTFLETLQPLHRAVTLLPSPSEPLVAKSSALEAGEAVLLSGTSEVLLVPTSSGASTTWLVEEVTAVVPPLPAGQARREVQAALEQAVEALVSLDLARERPELADELNDLVTAVVPPSWLPPRLAERDRSLLSRSLRLGGICQLALEDDGAARTAAQVVQREQALRPLLRAARHGIMAATDWWQH